MSPALSLRWFLGSQGGYIWPPDGSWSSKQQQSAPKALTLQESQYNLPAGQLQAFQLEVAGDKWGQGERGRSWGSVIRAVFLSRWRWYRAFVCCGICVWGGCRKWEGRSMQRKLMVFSLIEPDPQHRRKAPSFWTSNTFAVRIDLLCLVIFRLRPHWPQRVLLALLHARMSK